MRWIYLIAAGLGVLVGGLGGLWLLQGTGLVVIEPIACVGECEALTGPHAGWAVAGLVVLVLGAALLWWSLRRWRASRP